MELGLLEEASLPQCMARGKINKLKYKSKKMQKVRERIKPTAVHLVQPHFTLVQID